MYHTIYFFEQQFKICLIAYNNYSFEFYHFGVLLLLLFLKATSGHGQSLDLALYLGITDSMGLCVVTRIKLCVLSALIFFWFEKYAFDFSGKSAQKMLEIKRNVIMVLW